MILAPVLASFLFRKGARSGTTRSMTFITRIYSKLLGFAIRRHWVTVRAAALSLVGAYGLSQAIGSEFLPHLDEGRNLGARYAGAEVLGPSEGVHVANQARIILASAFPRKSRWPPVELGGPTMERIRPDFLIPSFLST